MSQQQTNEKRLAHLELVYRQLNELLENKYPKLIQILMGRYWARPNEELRKFAGQLEKLNKLPADKHHVKREWIEKFKRLLFSKNDLDNGDVHPVGLATSIVLYSSKAQSILNVKHLRSSSAASSSASNYCQILPNIDMTLIFASNNSSGTPLQWVRVKMTDVVNVRALLNDLPQSLNLHSYYGFPNTDYVEFYFTDKKVHECLDYFNRSLHVKSIVFYSNCKILRLLSRNKALVISNMMKFYYCYLTQKLDFVVKTNEDMRMMHHFFLIANVFFHTPNMKTVGNENFVMPLSLASGVNPHRKLFKFKERYEDLNELDKHLVENGYNLGATPMSEHSLEMGKKHKVYSLTNDRDFRIMGMGSKIGGRNVNELVINF